MIIYRLTDRIPLKIAELTFWVSPLSYEQKSNLLECKKMEGGKEVIDGGRRARLAIKYALKRVDGLMGSDGKPYEVVMDGSALSDESVDEILGLECVIPLVRACVSLMNGVSEREIEGVQFDLKGVVSEKKA
jgi:hypothetical protein